MRAYRQTVLGVGLLCVVFALAPAARAADDISSESAAQTITFPQPCSVPTGWSFFHFASASSGLPVSVTSSTPSICTASREEVTLRATTGKCTLIANQAGNRNFRPAAAVKV